MRPSRVGKSYISLGIRSGWVRENLLYVGGDIFSHWKTQVENCTLVGSHFGGKDTQSMLGFLTDNHLVDPGGRAGY